MSTEASTSGLTIFSNPKKNDSFLKKLRKVEKLNRGVIVEVSNEDEAVIAELAGAKAVLITMNYLTPMNLRRPTRSIIKQVKNRVKIPVMASVRLGHLGEAQILESFGLVDFIEESNSFPHINSTYINKHDFNVPFVCWCADLGEALNRVNEGAALIRIDATLITVDGTVLNRNNSYRNVIEVVRNNEGNTLENVRVMMQSLRKLKTLNDEEALEFAMMDLFAPSDLAMNIRKLKEFPTLVFSSGGVNNAEDARSMMLLGCDGVFLGYQVFKPGTDEQPRPDPGTFIAEIVQAVTHFNDNDEIAHQNVEFVD